MQSLDSEPHNRLAAPRAAGIDAVVYILAGGAGRRLGVLAEQRAKPAMPFGGRHHLIDFSLANAVNSGIQQVGVLTQHHASSVHRALDLWTRDGRPHGPSGASGCLCELPSGAVRVAGTASAVYRHLAFAERIGTENVLILAGDHVYAMDYRRLLDAHASAGADVTIAVAPVEIREACRFGILILDGDRGVTDFQEKPAEPASALASMGVYVFRAATLRALLAGDAANPKSSHDFGHDVIPLALARGLKVQGYEFNGYWRDVGTVDAYWEASMDLVSGRGPRLDDPAWPLPVRLEYRGTVTSGPMAEVRDSLLAGNCRVGGRVERSVVFPGVMVEPGAVVVESVLLPGAYVRAGATLRRSIIDEDAVVGLGATIGERASHGLTVIGAGAVIPAGMDVSAGVVVGRHVDRELVGVRRLLPGARVVREQPHRTLAPAL